MMKQVFACFCIGAAVVCMAGCERHPFKKTSTLAAEGLLPELSPVFVIYDDEIKTGGNLFVFPGGENQVVSLDETHNPHAGKKCISYTWNGGDLFDARINGFRHDFAGLDLAVSKGNADFPTAKPVNLTAGGFTKLTFWIRGSVTDNVTVKVEAVDDGKTATIPPTVVLPTVTSDWQKHELSIAGADLSAIKEYIKITFVYAQPTGTTTPGLGGTVFLDDIQLEK